MSKWLPDYLSPDEYEYYPEEIGEWEEVDEWEEALEMCGIFEDGGVYVCSAVGSEECEFDCKLRSWLGKKVDDMPEDEVESE